MGLDYTVHVDLEKAKKKLGLEPGGRVEYAMAEELIRLAEPYTPFDIAGLYEDPGYLIDSAHIENGNEVVWNGPYARNLYYHREYDFQGDPTRGAYWVEHMLQNGGMKQIEEAARKEMEK